MNTPPNNLKFFIFNIVLISLLSFMAIRTMAGTPNISLQKGVEPPEWLSQTSLFEGAVIELKPTADLFHYDVIQALWVDFAKKTRFIFLPAGTKIGFNANEPWKFPVGTIFVKHFQMETSVQKFQNIETRILIRKEPETENNWEGYTYKWDQLDAKLVNSTESPTVQINVDATAVGGQRTQNFKIPNRRQCLQCHNGSVGFVRSARTEQLNKVAGDLNQLALMNDRQMFDKDIGNPVQYTKFAAVDDESAGLEERARAYLDMNCAHCHNPSPLAMCSFTGLNFLYNELNVSDLVDSGHITLGAATDSSVYTRMTSLAQGMRMPFIGSNMRDDVALKTIKAWIDGLK